MINLPQKIYDEPMINRTFTTPLRLYNAARDKAKKEHRSVSGLIWQALELYVKGEFPPPEE